MQLLVQHLCKPVHLLQELQALITYIQMNKDSDTDWFTIQPEDGGKSWKGKCWCVCPPCNSSLQCCSYQLSCTIRCVLAMQKRTAFCGTHVNGPSWQWRHQAAAVPHTDSKSTGLCHVAASAGRMCLCPDGLPCCCSFRYVHNFIKYEFDFRFDVPATYPAVAPEIELPELEGKTAKMYRGGKICLTIHFKPLWAKNRSAAPQQGGPKLEG